MPFQIVCFGWWEIYPCINEELTAYLSKLFFILQRVESFKLGRKCKTCLEVVRFEIAVSDDTGMPSAGSSWLWAPFFSSYSGRIHAGLLNPFQVM